MYNRLRRKPLRMLTKGNAAAELAAAATRLALAGSRGTKIAP